MCTDRDRLHVLLLLLHSDGNRYEDTGVGIHCSIIQEGGHTHAWKITHLCIFLLFMVDGCMLVDECDNTRTHL